MTAHPHNVYAHPTARRAPSMADVWNEYPGAGGQLAPAVFASVAAVAPTAPVVHAPLPATVPVASAARRESRSWTWTKHVMQLAFVASVVLLVVSGGDSPTMALAYAGTGLLLMATMAVTDRQLFAHAGIDLEVVQAVTPHDQHEQALQYVFHHAFAGPAGHPLRADPLSPLLEQMHVVMPLRVDVT